MKVARIVLLSVLATFSISLTAFAQSAADAPQVNYGSNGAVVSVTWPETDFNMAGKRLTTEFETKSPPTSDGTITIYGPLDSQANRMPSREVYLNGTVVYANGTVITPNNTFYYHDGHVVYPNGSSYYPPSRAFSELNRSGVWSEYKRGSAWFLAITVDGGTLLEISEGSGNVREIHPLELGFSDIRELNESENIDMDYGDMDGDLGDDTGDAGDAGGSGASDDDDDGGGFFGAVGDALRNAAENWTWGTSPSCQDNLGCGGNINPYGQGCPSFGSCMTGQITGSNQMSNVGFFQQQFFLEMSDSPNH